MLTGLMSSGLPTSASIGPSGIFGSFLDLIQTYHAPMALSLARRLMLAALTAHPHPVRGQSALQRITELVQPQVADDPTKHLKAD